MNYTIKWNSKPLKFIEKLPKEISARIVEKLEKITDDPFRYLEHYEGADVYKLRVGDYRMLIDVDFTNIYHVVGGISLANATSTTTGKICLCLNNPAAGATWKCATVS